MTFSRNHTSQVLGMVDDLYSLVDEIILVDSSNKEGRKELLSAKRKKGWKKLKIFYMVPLGFVETCRSYGLTKCTNDWVLYLDADERPSEELRSDIKKIISTAKHSAFIIKRYEDVSGGELRSFTFQTRIFKKSMIRYKGIIDERPEVRGGTDYLDSPYYITHERVLMRHQFNEYYKRRHSFLEFESISYSQYNQLIQEYISRLRGMTYEEGRASLLARVAKKTMLAYESIGLKRQEQELSNFDYFAFALIKEFAFGAKGGNPNVILSGPRVAYMRAKEMARLKAMPDHSASFKIAKIINNVGMVKFLGLDKDSVISKLNRQYMDNRKGMQGLSLLAHLLREKYKERPH